MLECYPTQELPSPAHGKHSSAGSKILHEKYRVYNILLFLRGSDCVISPALWRYMPNRYTAPLAQTLFGEAVFLYHLQWSNMTLPPDQQKYGHSPYNQSDTYWYSHAGQSIHLCDWSFHTCCQSRKPADALHTLVSYCLLGLQQHHSKKKLLFPNDPLRHNPALFDNDCPAEPFQRKFPTLYPRNPDWMYGLFCIEPKSHILLRQHWVPSPEWAEA